MVTAAINVEYKLGIANLKKIFVKGNSKRSFEKLTLFKIYLSRLT